MKRLTVRDFVFSSFYVANKLQSWSIAECLKKLQQYENAEEDGLLVILPFKIGEKVYCITNHNSEIVEDVVDNYDIWSVKDGIKLRLSLRDYNSYVIAEFGKTVFLTREEAEAALDKENKHGHCL